MRHFRFRPLRTQRRSVHDLDHNKWFFHTSAAWKMARKPPSCESQTCDLQPLDFYGLLLFRGVTQGRAVCDLLHLMRAASTSELALNVPQPTYILAQLHNCVVSLFAFTGFQFQETFFILFSFHFASPIFPRLMQTGENQSRPPQMLERGTKLF